MKKNSMLAGMGDYSVYTAGLATAQERQLTLSDGVRLKLIDFIPTAANSSVNPLNPLNPSNPSNPMDSKDTRPLLFVAGWISLIDGWKDFLPVFTANRRVVYVETREKQSAELPSDRPATKQPAIRFDMDRMVQDLQEVVADQGWEEQDYDLVGSSLGATAIAEYLAETNPAVIKPHRAALIAPNADFPFPKWSLPIMRYAPLGLWAVLKPVAKWYLRNFRVEEPEQAAKYEKTLDSADIHRLKRNAITLIDYKIWPKLPLVTTPTLVIGASADKLHGLENIQRMGQEIPNGTTETLSSNKATHSAECAVLIQSYLDHTKANDMVG